MKLINFLITFLISFLVFSVSLLFRLNQEFYSLLDFHIFKPPLSFFHIFNLLYAILISIAVTEVISIYRFRNLDRSFYFKLIVNFVSFTCIRIFFNMQLLLFTFISCVSLFISLLYVYEEISFFNEKSTKYLDINVLYSLIICAFTFCLYVLNCS